MLRMERVLEQQLNYNDLPPHVSSHQLAIQLANSPLSWEGATRDSIRRTPTRNNCSRVVALELLGVAVALEVTGAHLRPPRQSRVVLLSLEHPRPVLGS
jgi:hypothetical protein